MTTAARRSALALVVTIGLAGCAANSETSGSDRAEAAPPLPAPMTCNAEAAQGHIGHSATQGMGAAIVKDAGARSLRWGPPGSAWTMDYREDRVNVRYDATMKIIEITCG